jgi:hypothetical protein
MINLTQGQTVTSIIFTGTEQCVLTVPSFYFIFTSRQTKDVVEFLAVNISSYTTRYDEVQVNVSSYFDDKKCGIWSYKIYEYDTDNTEQLGLVEEGFMKLHPATEFSPTKYTGQSNIVTAHGE